MWHFCKNPRSIAAAERRFLGRSALPWPADLVAPLDVRCRVLQWVGTLCSGICRNFNKSEPHKAFVKFQRHNCSMKSISFGFYAQLSVVCMWLSQCIDIIYTIYILYTSIKCVSFGWPIHQPLGLKGLVFETAPNEKKKKNRMDEAAVRAHGALLEGNRSRTCDIIDMKHWKHPCHSPQCNIPLRCGYFWRLKFLDFFLTWCPTVDGRNPPSQLVFESHMFTIMFHISAC